MIKFFCFVCGLLLSAILLGIALSLMIPVRVEAQTRAETSSAGVSSELQSITADGVSHAATPLEAAREIQAKAVEDTAREQVLELIGDKRYQKSRVQVESKIIKQAARFMPFIQPGQVAKQPDGSWKMTTEMKVSQPSLRRMVLDAGLLSDNDGSASIVPLISFIDRSKNISTRWWMGEEHDESHRFLLQLSREVYDRLQAEFSHQGFHMIRPVGAQASSLPEAFRAERMSNAELKSVSDYFQAPLVLKGDVRIRPSQDVANAFTVSIRLQVIQSAGGRTIAEISRSIDTEAGNTENVVRSKLSSEMPEISKDLAAQVLDAWQRGTINANLLKLAVRGNLNPKQLSDFKSALQRSVREIKNLHERLFESGQVVFDVDFAGQASGLSERMRSLQLPGFVTSFVADNADQGLVVQVRPRM